MAKQRYKSFDDFQRKHPFYIPAAMAIGLLTASFLSGQLFIDIIIVPIFLLIYYYFLRKK